MMELYYHNEFKGLSNTNDTVIFDIKGVLKDVDGKL